MIDEEDGSDTQYYRIIHECDKSDESNDILLFTHHYQNQDSREVKLDGRVDKRMPATFVCWFEADHDVQFRMQSPCCFLDIKANNKFIFYDPISNYY